MTQQLNRSLRAVFIIGICLLMLVIAFSQAYLDRLQAATQSEASRHFSEMTMQSASVLRNKIEGDIGLLESISDSMDWSLAAPAGQVIGGLRKELEIHPQFQRMGVMHPDGLSVTTDGYDGMLPLHTYAQNALNGLSGVSGPVEDSLSGGMVNIYGVPIKSGDKTAAILFATISTHDFSEMTAVHLFDNQTTSSIIDTAGNILAGPQLSGESNIYSNLFLSEEETHLLRTGLQNNKSGIVTYQADGEAMYLSYAPIGINDWYIILTVPANVMTQYTSGIIEYARNTWIILILMFTALFVVIVALLEKRAGLYKNMAYTDELTGIGNWEKMQGDIPPLLARQQNKRYAFIAFDIDGFRRIKEVFGAKHSDELIVRLAEILCTSTDKDELCARYVEDHFMLFLHYANDFDITGRIEQIIVELNSSLNHYRISFSFGIYKVDERSIPPVLMNDYALYAKREIKGDYKKQFCFFSEELHRRISMEEKVENAMEDALFEDQFKVYYQPKYSVSDEKISGSEALCRWVHPEFGFLSPGDFIPVFEKNGFITTLDIYIFYTVCQSLNRWIRTGIPVKPVSVNLSRMHLGSEEIADTLKLIADEQGVPTSLIEIEFTENTLMEYSPVLDNVVNKLHEYGFSISMDDFGKGYSSLGLLKSLHVDVLKIDSSFFSDDIHEPRTSTIVSSVIQMAKELSIKTVSEGIETKEQVEFLRLLGCDMIQGYYYSRPLSESAYEILLLDEINIP